MLLGRQRAPQYLAGDSVCRYLRVANIKDDRIDFDDLNTMDLDPNHFAKYRLEPGDILVSEGQSPELLGQSAIFRGHGVPLCFRKIASVSSARGTEQHRIVAEGDRRLSLIRPAEAQITADLARAKRLRRSILQAAFSQGADASAPA